MLQVTLAYESIVLYMCEGKVLMDNYCVELSNARINWFSDGFFPSASRLWNSLPSVFPASFNLPSFKRQVYHHLRDKMA